MRIELLGAIGLTALFAAACGGDDNSADSLGSTTGSGGAGIGGSAAGAAGTTVGTGGFITGNGGGGGGTPPGGGGTPPGGGGTPPGGGGTPQGDGGPPGGTLTCPTTQPTNGTACPSRGTCTYGSTQCGCRRVNGGQNRQWMCANFGDGGFTRPDGGFPPVTDGGTRSRCTAAADCTTGGDVCCGFGTRFALCLASATCTANGGTPRP